MSITKSELENLRDKSLSARDFSYSPYSKFRVGAVLLTESGEWIQGANVENASYGGAICAERVAITRAIVSTPHRGCSVSMGTGRSSDGAYLPTNTDGGTQEVQGYWSGFGPFCGLLPMRYLSTVVSINLSCLRSRVLA